MIHMRSVRVGNDSTQKMLLIKQREEQLPSITSVSDHFLLTTTTAMSIPAMGKALYRYYSGFVTDVSEIHLDKDVHFLPLKHR